MSQQPTVLPVANGANLFAAIRLLVDDDPVASVFARAVLRAFAQYAPTGRMEQLRALLLVWETVQTETTVPLVQYDPAVIEIARRQVFA